LIEEKKKPQVEILSPAGSYESFLAAIHAGADAVYAGGPRFGARAFADNFTEETLKQAIDYAHFHGRKVYLTVNTLLKDREIETLHDYLEPLYLHGLDAVIVQDVGVLELIRHDFPDLEIHASTQMSSVNVKAAQFLQSQGVTRVVPAREISLEEIQEIYRATGMEIECFVHGALCYCYSGQCLLSSLIGGRSGNRGQCAQPCRLPYSVDQSSKKEYVLSPKDICTLDLIPELIEAGVYSFKIEGRMKRPEYVAAVTSIYRKYTDLYLKKGKSGYRVEQADREALMDLYNRGGFSQGYYKERNGRDMIAISRPNHAGVPAARVLSQKGRELTVETLADIHKGDLLELNLQRENYSFGKEIPKGTKTVILVPKKEQYQKGQILNRIRNQKLMTEMKEQYLEGATKEQISGYLRAAVGEPAMLTVWTEDISVTVYSEQTVQEAQNQPMEVSRIQKQLSKTGATEFVFEHLEIDLEGKVFLPMQQLNELRRQALEKLELEICGKFRRTSTEQPLLKQNSEEKKTEGVLLSVLTETLEQLESVLDSEAAERIYIDSNIVQDLFEDARLQHLCKKVKRSSAKIFLAMPHIFRADAVRKFEQHYDRFLEIAQDGVLIRNCESFQFLKQHGFDRTILLDHNLYVFNQYSRQFWKRNGVELFTAPMELNAEELNVLGLEESELVIYGRIPVMTSAQCVVKTTNGCTHHPVTTTLTDRRGKQFPVKNHCGFCYNIVYNSAPLSLFDEREEWMRMHPRSIRVQFSTETGSEVTRILNAALAVNNTLNAVSGMSGEEFTRGHFRRGIT